MRTALIRLEYLVALATVLIVLAACDHQTRKRTNQNMNTVTATTRVLQSFEKTKTVCFGRFLIDVPASTTVSWGATDIPLGVDIHLGGADKVQGLAQKFIDELKSEKAIYHQHVPLLISVDNVQQPYGKIITGYEDFGAINGLKINGYFKFGSDGLIIDARPLMEKKDKVIADITSMSRRLRHRTESEIPAEPGNCIEHAFLVDKPDTSTNPPSEHISIGFRLTEFPDTHLSILLLPSNPYHSESNSLEWQLERLEKDLRDENPNHPQLQTKYLRRGPRKINDWLTGFEALSRSPERPEVNGIHDFAMDFKGVPSDPFKPYADIRMQTGVADNTAGATKAILTDEEAVAVWDRITSSIRVRPTTAAPVKSSEVSAGTHVPLGLLAATGRTCPQTGWWAPEGGQRQHIKAGERMPHLISSGEPSLWQKLTGERPSHRTATMWKLVSYDNMPPQAPDTSPEKKA
jgi:hypothetical protein